MERISVYVAPEDATVISLFCCEQDSVSPRCLIAIDLVKQLTTILQARHFRQNEMHVLLEQLEAMRVTREKIRLYLLCNLTLRETLQCNRLTRDCWILALQRMDFTQRKIADAIQLGQHFAIRCRADASLDPCMLVMNTLLHAQPPSDLPFPIPTI